MQVLIPSPLWSYTKRLSQVESSGDSVADLLRDLDRQFPGIRFRMIDEQDQIRQHIRIFRNRLPVRDLATRLSGTDEILILCAISGG